MGALKYNTEILVMWKVDCGSRNIACLDDIFLSSIAEQDLVITSICWNAEEAGSRQLHPSAINILCCTKLLYGLFLNQKLTKIFPNLEITVSMQVA